MAMRWEREQDGRWVQVPADALPEAVRSKKSVIFAHAGVVLEVPGPDGRPQRYRLVDAARPPAAGEASG